jgi:hypothetical protein
MKSSVSNPNLISFSQIAHIVLWILGLVTLVFINELADADRVLAEATADSMDNLPSNKLYRHRQFLMVC